jgi:hypothetical protein
VNAQPRRLWASARVRLALLTFAVLLVAYLGSYAWLSRRGIREARDSGLDGFLYVSTDEAFATHDLRMHHSLAVFYSPASWFDQALFGTPAPVRGIMFGLAP